MIRLFAELLVHYPGDAVRLRLTIAVIALFFVSISVSTLAYFLITPRYMADFTPFLALLAVIGSLSVERLLANQVISILINSIMALAAVFTVALAILISFDYHNRMLLRTWPTAYHSLESFFNSSVLKNAF